MWAAIVSQLRGAAATSREPAARSVGTARSATVVASGRWIVVVGPPSALYATTLTGWSKRTGTWPCRDDASTRLDGVDTGVRTTVVLETLGPRSQPSHEGAAARTVTRTTWPWASWDAGTRPSASSTKATVRPPLVAHSPVTTVPSPPTCSCTKA